MMLRKISSFLLLIILLFILSSCSGGGDQSAMIEDQVEAVVAATLTKEAFLDSIEYARETVAAENQSTQVQLVTPTETKIPTPTLSPTPEPEHLILPGSPSTLHTYISDIVTVDLAKNKTAIGDSYAWSRLERPYTPNLMQYRSYLDIYQVNLQVADPWVYITFVLIGKLPPIGDIRYAVELDLDHDGRGDFLVMASLPPDTTWTTDNVWVLADEDEDIGGLYPLYIEESTQEQNGYEREIFSSGVGEDRDLAWVRRDPEERNQLQLAFKESITGVLGFMWSAWTDEGIKDPSQFDFNDHFSYDEAGSPNKGNYRYPVKAVALVDSTCRSWYGFIPTGDEPGLCFTGDQVQDLPGYGWCEVNAKRSGCGENPCLLYCPGNRFCIPCKLPQ